MFRVQGSGTDSAGSESRIPNPDPSAFRILEAVVDRLAERAERTPGGCTWFTPPELLPQWQRELCPKGYYNLGLAHGVPGVIAVLGGAVATGVRPDIVPQLLEGA